MKLTKIIILVFIILISILSSLSFFGEERGDSKAYKELTYFIQGKDAELISPFASRPITPFLASLIEPFFGINNAFGIVNLLFLILTLMLLYDFFSGFYKSKKIALIIIVLYAFSFSSIFMGSRVLVESGTFFFLFLSIYLIERSLGFNKTRYFLFFGVVIALAILNKFVLLLALIYLFISILFEKELLKNKLKTALNFILTVIISLIPFVIWKSVLKVKLQPLIGALITNVKNGHLFDIKYISAFIVRSGMAFQLAWIFAIPTVFRDRNKLRRVYYLKTFIVLILHPIAGFITNAFVFNYRPEHTFAMFPLILPLSAFGLFYTSRYLFKNKMLSNIFIIVILLIYILTSFIGALYAPETPVRDSFIDLNFIKGVFIK